jgi:DNA repair exonuclease SbcCD ATPase subunit
MNRFTKFVPQDTDWKEKEPAFAEADSGALKNIRLHYIIFHSFGGIPLKIKWLEVEGFKAFKARQRFEFGDRTEIIGDNHQGKTSIMEGIVFALAGADKEGKANATDRLMTVGCNEMRVCVGIEVNGQAHEIERQSFKLKTKTETKILINRLPGQQEQIETIIGGRKQFLAAFLPEYFCSLEAKDARLEIMNLLPVPKQDEVIALLMEEYAEALKEQSLLDPDFYITKEKGFLKENEQELLRLEGQASEIENALTVEIGEEIKTDATGIELLKETIAAIESAKPALIDLLPLQQKRSALLTEYQTLQKGLKFEESFIECDNCGHKINLNAEQERKNAEITEQMAATLESEKAAAKELEEVEQENKRRIDQFNQVNAATLADLKEQLRTAESNLQTVQQHNMRVKVQQEAQSKALARRNQVAADIAKVKDIIENSKQRIKAAQEYIVQKCELQMKQVGSHLNRVSIRLFDIVKSTQEIKTTFKLDYDGKEYRVLSTSERIRCGLEVAHLMRTLTGQQYPVFIDCAESITYFDDPGTQLFTARVVKGADLSINAEGEMSIV